MAGNSLGGLLALELDAATPVRSVTALSPGGFWTPAERRYAFGVLRGMYAGAGAAGAVVESLARSALGAPR